VLISASSFLLLGNYFILPLRAECGFEHINRRFKIFRILAERYRNRRRRYGLRCNLIAALYNYELAQVVAHF